MLAEEALSSSNSVLDNNNTADGVDDSLVINEGSATEHGSGETDGAR